MLEDRLQSIDNLQKGDNLQDEKNDIIGAKYLKVANTVSFSVVSLLWKRLIKIMCLSLLL